MKRLLPQKLKDQYTFKTEKALAMLSDQELEMWEFGPAGIFDMWESEQITGDPGNSLYLRGDEVE